MQVGLIRLGKHVITPTVGARSGQERGWGLLFKRMDMRSMKHFIDGVGIVFEGP